MILSRTIARNMSQSVIKKIINNAETAEKRLAELRSKVEEVKKLKVEAKILELTQENAKFYSQVAKAKDELCRIEILHGKKQYPIPGKKNVNASEAVMSPSVPIYQVKEQAVPKKEKKEKNKVNKGNEKAPTDGSEVVVDVRKLDFRIGKIVDINKHPDADSLYVEKIDCGEEKPRTVVSGLVNHVPIEEMRNRIVMVLCNLKPVKMRGVTSEAMVMCASSPDKVEVLLPPSNAVPGDLVSCEGYPREPEVQLNPKKKIFETCAPDLQTNDEKVACYKGSPLAIPGKGPVVAPSLKNVNVK